ncbi:MAG: AAA domain-containing protein [Pirellulaceae bacterium]|nr:AAA domain-containing protein [Pirellulaceae bacterium]
MSVRPLHAPSDHEVELHFARMARWLRMESHAEIERLSERKKAQGEGNAEKGGETLLNMIVLDQVAGLGGFQLVTLGRQPKAPPMPWHRLRVGAPVVVSPMDSDLTSAGVSGVVSERTSETLQVAMSRIPDERRLRIDMAADEVTRQRQSQALRRAQSATGRLAHLRKVLLGQRVPEFGPIEELDLPDYLNASQQDAIRVARSAYDLAVIHGPPGTGKTTTLVALIVQAVVAGEKVFACAPSNTAVDHLLEELVDAGQRVVRIGHPARVTPRLQHHCLDGLMEQHESQVVVKAMRRQAEDLLRQAEKWTRAPRASGDRHQMRRAARDLEQEAKNLERYMARSILDGADIVCATTTFNDDFLGNRHFDLGVIDEACQSTEPGSWCPLPFVDKIVLAGDPQQLPPTVLSLEAAAEGFDRSLMQRVMELHGPGISRLLDVQYRMHQQIMEFSSEQLYEGRLIADRSVRDHRLCDLPGVIEKPITMVPVEFYDSAGANWDEELEPSGLSKRNRNEAKLVLKKVRELMAAGVDPHAIGVIAPYAAQVRLLRDSASQQSPRDLWRNVEIDTVDGFQGREKEAIIISLVRSNPQNEIGFLADRRRMNVALTRARRKLMVIGDSATLGIEPFYQAFLQYISDIQAYHTVWEEDIE